MMETLDLKVLGYENDDCVNVGGTCYLGVIKTTYDQLVDIFGEPTFTDANPHEKVNAEWTVQAKDKDNTVFTVYNWKDGFIPTDKYDWHIGGYDYNALSVATDILDNAKKKV